MQFFSRKYKNLRVVIEARSTLVIEGIPIIKGLNNRFPLGLAVDFVDGVFKTNDDEVIKALKGHPNYGTHFFAEDSKPGEATEEAVRVENQKKEYQDKLASKCQYCGDQFSNQGLLAVHIKKCPRKDEQQ